MTSMRVMAGLLVTLAFCGSAQVAAAQPPFTVGTAKAAPGQTATGAIEVPAGSDAALSIPVVVVTAPGPGRCSRSWPARTAPSTRRSSRSSS